MENSMCGDSSKKIQDFIDEFTKTLPPDLIEYLRSNFQVSMADWMYTLRSPRLLG